MPNTAGKSVLADGVQQQTDCLDLFYVIDYPAPICHGLRDVKDIEKKKAKKTNHPSVLGY